MWRICKIDARPSRYLSEPQRAHLPTQVGPIRQIKPRNRSSTPGLVANTSVY